MEKPLPDGCEADRTGTIPTFVVEDIKLQANLALEIMALVGFAGPARPFPSCRAAVKVECYETSDL